MHINSEANTNDESAITLSFSFISRNMEYIAKKTYILPLAENVRVFDFLFHISTNKRKT